MKVNEYETKKKEISNLINYVTFIKIIFIINAQKKDTVGRVSRQVSNIFTSNPYIDTYCKAHNTELACNTNITISTGIDTDFVPNERNIRLLAIYMIYSNKMIIDKLEINIPDFNDNFLNKLDSKQIELGHEYINLLNLSKYNDDINNMVIVFDTYKDNKLFILDINKIQENTNSYNSSITQKGGKTSRKKSTKKRKQKKAKKSRSKKI